ncbi:MAG TPA: hypothetical protein VF054_09650 [Micromonosporaceae bacterium]
MYVRLAVAWTDLNGVAHGVGDVVDIDAVTLAELEEQGVVENPEDNQAQPTWIGPGSPDPTDGTADPTWIGPGSEPTDGTADPTWIGPGSEPTGTTGA